MKDAVLAELKEEAAKKDQETRNDLRCDLRRDPHQSYVRFSHSTRLLMRQLRCLRALCMPSHYASFLSLPPSRLRVKCAAYEATLATVKERSQEVIISLNHHVNILVNAHVHEIDIPSDWNNRQPFR